jgi:hypothetical protein
MNPHDPTDNLVAKLQSAGFDPRETGPGSWESRCLSHNGSRSNLSVKRGDDGRVLLFCHHVPECDHKAIARALKMDVSDLFPPPPTPEDALAHLIRQYGRPTVHWIYPLASGRESFRVYRFDFKKRGKPDKTFRPVHPVPGGWKLSDPPGQLPLYHRPELAAADRVFVTEGEKAADLVRSLGLTATTSAHGAKSAGKTDWTPLAGRDVVLLLDNDLGGEHYGKTVLDVLARLQPAPRVRLVRLRDLWKTTAPIPEKGDTAEWLAEGVPEAWGTEQCRAEIERVADAAPEEDLGARPETESRPARSNDQGEPADDSDVGYSGLTDEEMGIVDATEIKLENPVWLWPRRFLKGKINLIAGEGGDGKTTIAILIGAIVTRGGLFPDGTPSGDPGRVLILAAEDGAGDTILPRFVAAGADVSFGKIKVLTASVNIPKKGSRPALVHPVSLQDLVYWRRVFEKHRPAVLIIDPLPAYLGRGVNDHKNADIQQFLKDFARLANEFGVCVIAITHTGKATDRKLIHKVLGSVAYTNASRVVHVTIRDPDDPAIRYLERPKCNLDEPVDALVYRLVSAEFEKDGEAFKSSLAVFEAEPMAIDAEAMANPKRDGSPTRGPDPAKETAAAVWLHDFLDGRAGWTERRDAIAAAGAAGLIGKQHKVTTRWSNLTMLYRAKKRVPMLENERAGRWIDEQDMATSSDRFPKICWRLMREGVAY